MSAQHNDIHVKAGLDPITDEEHENITSTLSAVAEASAGNGVSAMDATPSAPAEPTAGTTVDNVFYINVAPGVGLTQDWKDKLTAITNDVNLSSSFLSTKAKGMANDKMTTNPPQLDGKDQAKVANYIAKVINALIQNAPWIATTGVVTQQKSFKMSSENFHQALVTQFTQGLNLPSTILNDLEGFLTNCQNLIKNGAKEGGDTKQIFIYITIYVKDDVLQVWRPYVRTIYFKPTNKLINYSVGKNDNRQDVDVDFEYVQYDGLFDENQFVNDAKPVIQPAQQGAIKDFVNGTINVSVD